ncbi:unnamed protein product [Camellia sinensis]
MNEKATISKELNAKHTKILEGLLKLPENRECADCRCKYVRVGSTLGKCEPGGIYMHAMLRNTSESWSSYLKGTVYNFGYMATGAAMGNEKANSYWEAEASPDLDKSGTENFIRAKYQEKKWVSKKATQPIPILGENSSRFDKLDHSEAKAGIPKKIRKFSLEEEILTKHMSQVAPITRTHGLLLISRIGAQAKFGTCAFSLGDIETSYLLGVGSLDMTNRLMTSAPPRGMIPEHNTSIQNGNGTTDLFSLLYVQDSKPDPFIVPSRWATFESLTELISIGVEVAVLGIRDGQLWNSGKLAGTSMAKDRLRWRRRRPSYAEVARYSDNQLRNRISNFSKHSLDVSIIFIWKATFKTIEKTNQIHLLLF